MRLARRLPITRRAATAAALVLLTGAGTAALAQAPQPAAAPVTNANHAADQALDIRQIYDRLEAAGYRDIREIERSGSRYEVKARNARDERVKLDVNAATGAVERSRTHR